MKRENKFKIGDKVVRKSNPEQVLEIMNIHILGGGQSFRYDLSQKGSTCDICSTTNFCNVRENKIEAYVEKPKFKVGDYVRIKKNGRAMQIESITLLLGRDAYRLSALPIIFGVEDIIPYEPYAADFYVCESKNGRKSIAVYPSIETEYTTAYEYACDYTTHELHSNIFLNLNEYPDIVLLRPDTDIEKQKLIDAVEKLGKKKHNKATKEWDNVQYKPKEGEIFVAEKTEEDDQVDAIMCCESITGLLVSYSYAIGNFNNVMRSSMWHILGAIRPATPEEKNKLIKAVEEKYNKTYDEETKSWVDFSYAKMPNMEEVCSGLGDDMQRIIDAYGDKVVQFKVLANELSDLYKQKNEAYGDSFGKSVEKYGRISALTRMSDKWNRLENLIMNEDTYSGDESVIYTLKDLASYCLMTIIELKK